MMGMFKTKDFFFFFNFYFLQYEYNDWLAAECKAAPSEEWRKEMYILASKSKIIRPETYRDEWDDEHLIVQAHEDFRNNFEEAKNLIKGWSFNH